MMGEYSIILYSTPRGVFKNGSMNHVRQLATYINELELGKKSQCLHEVKLGSDALKSWVFGIKNLAETKQIGQKHE